MNEVKEWIGKADKDIITAKVNLDNREYEAAAFFSQLNASKKILEICDS